MPEFTKAPAFLIYIAQEAIMFIVFQRHPTSTNAQLLELTPEQASDLERRCINAGCIVDKSADMGKAITGFGEKLLETLNVQALFMENLA